MRIILGILTNMHRKNLAKRGAFSSRWDQKDGHESKDIIPHNQRARDQSKMQKCPEMRFSASTGPLGQGLWVIARKYGSIFVITRPERTRELIRSKFFERLVVCSVVFSQLSLERHNWRKTCCVLLCDFGKDESSVMSRSDGYNTV
jgi:hypothetical protein